MKIKIFSLALLLTTFSSAEYIYTYKPTTFNIESAVENAPVNISTLSCTYYYCIALKEGEVWTVGENGSGQLGIGSTLDKTTWQNTGVTATEVKALSRHFSAILKDGNVWMAGYNQSGNLGINSTSNQTLFVDSGLSLSSLTEIDGGNTFAVAVKDGKLWFVGENENGQSGGGGTSDIKVWSNMGFDADKAVAGGHTAYYIKDNILYGMGRNTEGQLGQGNSTTNYTTPVQITTNVKDVDAGYYHLIIQKLDNNIYTLGHNNQGQLGLGNTISKNLIQNTNEYADNVYAGFYQSYMVKNGKIWATGRNLNYESGFSTQTDRVLFEDTEISAVGLIKPTSTSFSINILKDGKRYMSGQNSNGIAGDGSTSHKAPLTEVPLP